MKVTLIKEERESGKETLSTCNTNALFEKIKSETKSGHITALRKTLPALLFSSCRYK